MPFQLTSSGQDYTDYASGRVFYGAPGQATFSVRLTSEIFQRCAAIRQEQGMSGPVTLYDPCCGSAYHLATCAFLHGPQIKAIIGSDVDGEMLSLAARNLGLLTAVGMTRRISEIETMLTAFGKNAHADARQSAGRLQQQLQQNLAQHPIETKLFRANVLQPTELKRELKGQHIDMVLTDVPYGRRATWQGLETDTAVPADAIWQMLDSLLAVVEPHTLVAIAADKAQKCRHEQYTQRAKFQIGKRRIFLLQPVYGKIQTDNERAGTRI